MKKLFISILIMISFPAVSENFKLQEGDLVFIVDNSASDLVKAIKESTSLKEEIPFTHVGTMKKENGKIFILEATSPEGVVKTPLDAYFAKAALLETKPLIAVGRLKSEYRYAIPSAISNTEQKLGKKYDYAYDEQNDAFYCSELIRLCFLDSLGTPIFEPLPMSFKNKETGLMDQYWTSHFEKLGVSIPEGKPGTNPADMAKASVINIVYRYYQ